MDFTSLSFIFIYLPCVIGIYYISKKQYRKNILLIFSIIFYFAGCKNGLLLLFFSVIINFICGKIIELLANRNSKYGLYILIATLVFNVGILFFQKYFNFTVYFLDYFLNMHVKTREIMQILGISFITFQEISYCIDIYKRKIHAEDSFIDFALYIFYFPKVLSGPLVNYKDFTYQINNPNISLVSLNNGIKRTIIGVSKKMIIANNLQCIVNDLRCADIISANPVNLWIRSIAFSLYIYFDFSSYSDVSIGISEMFGIKIKENFNYPYISKTVTEFWRRWHISLSEWFRDYLYIPLGGSRNSRTRTVLNLFVVWLVTGIWHGANYNYIIWGISYFAVLIIEKFIIMPEKRTRLFRIIYQIYTLFIINIEWVIFEADGAAKAIQSVLAMFGYYNNKFIFDSSAIRIIREYWIFILAGIFLSTPLLKKIKNKLINKKYLYIIDYIEPFVYLALFALSVSYIIIGMHNPYVYFEF